MEGMTVVIMLMALSVMLGIFIGGAAHDINYDAGWEAGVKDVLSTLPEEAVRMLAEEEPRDQSMQMMIDS